MSALGFYNNVSRWLNQTIYLAKYEGRDEFGNPKWGIPFPARARVEGHSVRVVDVTGEEVVAEWAIMTQETVGKEDRVWLPWENPADLERAHIPQRVRPAPYFGGERVFTEVWL